MENEYTTIVLKHEPGEMPIKGFNSTVLGCEVVALAVGNLCEENCLLEEEVVQLKADYGGNVIVKTYASN
jgi:hypothetical protein